MKIKLNEKTKEKITLANENYAMRINTHKKEKKKKESNDRFTQIPFLTKHILNNN